MSTPAALCVCVSGGGRSLTHLAERIAAGELDARITLVVSSKAGAGALERARAHGLEATVIDGEKRLSPEEFSRELFAACESRGVELVVLAGFLRLLAVPAAWRGRVINIHPALLPAFGGKGYYGMRVHRAVLEHGCWFSGCTVHYVDDQYDHGPILLQRCVRVEPADSPESLAARVFEEEQLALPEAIRLHFSRAREEAAPPRER